MPLSARGGAVSLSWLCRGTGILSEEVVVFKDGATRRLTPAS